MEKLKDKMKQWFTKGAAWRIAAAVIVLVLGITGIAVAYADNSARQRLEEQLELGNQYLDDMDYEQAIAAFEMALEIDDKCVEAYLGLAEAYTRLGELDKAIEILELGILKTDSEELKEKLEELQALKEELEAEQSAEEESEKTGATGTVGQEKPKTEEVEEETEEEEKAPQKEKKPQNTNTVENADNSTQANTDSQENAVAITGNDTQENDGEQENTDAQESQTPERQIEMQWISVTKQIQYGDGLLSGARIEASLCEYDGSAAPIVLGVSETGEYTYTGEYDMKNQYIKLKVELPEGYYFIHEYDDAGCNEYYNYDANVGRYSGVVHNIWRGMNDIKFVSHVVNPLVDGDLSAEPSSITICVGEKFDLRNVRLVHTKPDGSKEDVSMTGKCWIQEWLYDWENDTSIYAIKAGTTKILMKYQNCWVNVPIVIRDKIDTDVADTSTLTIHAGETYRITCADESGFGVSVTGIENSVIDTWSSIGKANLSTDIVAGQNGMCYASLEKDDIYDITVCSGQVKINTGNCTVQKLEHETFAKYNLSNGNVLTVERKNFGTQKGKSVKYYAKGSVVGTSTRTDYYYQSLLGTTYVNTSILDGADISYWTVLSDCEKDEYTITSGEMTVYIWYEDIEKEELLVDLTLGG